MEKLQSSPADWVGKAFTGFVVNAGFSAENTQKITTWLDGLRTVAPEGLFIMDARGLHITVMDWVAPLFDYGGQDKRALFEALRPEFQGSLDRIVAEVAPFDVHFDDIRVTPGTIILVGQDAGQFISIRQQFVQSVTLPEGGKEPPTIIHSSLARSVQPVIDLAPVVEYARHHPLDIVQHIDELRLVETRKEPMQDFEVLHRFVLGGA